MFTERQRQFLAELASIILGLFFVASGVGKLLDVAAFRQTFQAYGLPDSIAAVAAVVPPLEVLLGLLLCFQRRSRQLALLSLALLVVFTLAFGYAYLFRNVEDCGCFGAISALQSPPEISILRNLLFISLALLVWKAGNRAPALVLPAWQWLVIGSVSALAFLLAGVSSERPLQQPQHPYFGKKIEQTLLHEIVNMSPDSTYLVYAYSPVCGSCWDAAENVKAYKRLGIVDEIVGLSYGDEGDLMVFEDSFAPNFRTRILDRDTFTQLASATPTAFFVQDGIIMNVQTNSVMSAVRFYEDGLRKSLAELETAR